MQLGAGVVRAGEAPAAEANGWHAEVAPVLLHEQVCSRLGHAEQRMESRHSIDIDVSIPRK